MSRECVCVCMLWFDERLCKEQCATVYAREGEGKKVEPFSERNAGG